MAKLVSKYTVMHCSRSRWRAAGWMRSGETRAMQTALEENPELFALMRHPKIVKEEKVKIIESIFTVRCVQNWWTFAHDCGKGSFAQIGKVLAYLMIRSRI